MIYSFYRKISEDLEFGFHVETTGPLTTQELAKIQYLVMETYEPNMTDRVPFLLRREVLEIGPRRSMETPFSSNAVSICEDIALPQVTRIEHTRRYKLSVNATAEILVKKYFDNMTEEIYVGEVKNFDTGKIPEDVTLVDIIEHGEPVLEKVNRVLGLGMDTKDIEYYYDLFAKILTRNPTDVELVQLGNANSEHSRHHFWKGIQIIDGEKMPLTLMEIVERPLACLEEMDATTLVAFRDNAGVIQGFRTEIIMPVKPGEVSEMRLREKVIHITCTAETHNHPTFVAPFPGAQTGSGGRIRDNTAVGRGGWTGIGVAGYFVGNLFIPGYEIPYEIPGEVVGKNKPSKYASPLEILIKGSNGVSSYGNEFGEPLPLGFCRTFGQIVNGEWREPRKPILYSGGIGHVYAEHIEKEKAEIGMLIVAIGGPAYPIAVGGGAASSLHQGQNSEELDLKSVQRGNAWEENKTNRVIRACAEMGEDSPISSIHDQGAGGPSNVLTELMEPLGGTVNIRKIILGDKTMSVLQIWSAEYQERYGLLIRPEKLEQFQSICEREGVNCEVLGKIDGNHKVVVEDPTTGDTPVNLDLGDILTNIPQKTFNSTRRTKALKPLELPEVTIAEAIEKVFRIPSVGSKSYLVHKVDRSVTGLVAQQQCCGIAQIPISDYSLNAQSHFGFTGTVSALGENPNCLLIDPKAGARKIVGEVITNLAGVKIRDISDIRCHMNEMWPAKLPHEGAELYDTVKAASDLLVELGIAVTGGKDSLSMAAEVQGEIVKAPGSLVILGYAPVPDVRKKVTPDIKMPGESLLGLIDLGLGKNRLGGSALAQAFNQLGDECPDIEASLLKRAFRAIQEMIRQDLILAIHDRSEGGLITTVTEMCMASRCGFVLYAKRSQIALRELLTEELGFVIEIPHENERVVQWICEHFGIPITLIGVTQESTTCGVLAIFGQDEPLLDVDIKTLRGWWEATSYQIDKLQTDPECAGLEYLGHSIHIRHDPEPANYRLTFEPRDTPSAVLNTSDNPRVAILRAKGTNGDREMHASCLAAGLQPFDVNMWDLLHDKISLDAFQMLIFPGGFSYMDVFGSAKGWAGTILFNGKLKEMLDRFYERSDTLSLGVCNGCQLMTLLGWFPWKTSDSRNQPRFIGNTSGRFESRWVQVEILRSPSVLLSGMVGSKLGVWVAHGEGRLYWPDSYWKHEATDNHLLPMAYVNPDGLSTEVYPYNPNGSPGGITALCSPDGRHLAMMPHPERCSNGLWQWPWMPASWRKLEVSPWLRMFQNARTWCVEHR